MSAMTKNSARLRDEERARLIWLLTTDKAIISALSGKLTWLSNMMSVRWPTILLR